MNEILYLYVINVCLGRLISISRFPPNFLGPVMITLLTLGAD